MSIPCCPKHHLLLLLIILFFPFLITATAIIEETTTFSQRLLRHAHSEQYADLMDDDYRNRYHATPTRLSDVWLCLGMAFGWAVFLVRTFVGSTTMERYESEGLHIKGSVLESTVNPDGEAGIPTYHALIDYVYAKDGNNNDATTANPDESNTIQIRKAFPTETLLDKGFSNVELLVLPDDPTSGVLLQDWEREVEEERKNEAETLGITRFSYALGILFIALSIFGAFHAVRLLPSEEALSGWISLLVGILLLGPVAFMCYSMSSVVLSRTHHNPFMACHTGQGTIHCMTPEQFHDVYNAQGRQQQQMNAMNTNASSTPTFNTSNMTDAQKNYYFVHMPQRGEGLNTSMTNSSVSSLSTRSFSRHQAYESRFFKTLSSTMMERNATPETVLV